MGAVLHTLNIRLSPEQIAYIANEAEDQVIIADLSVAGQLAAVLPMLETVHTVIAVGDGDIDALTASGKTVLRYDEILAAESPTFDWPDIDENSAAAMCYTSGTTGNPKGVVYSHRSSYLHSMIDVHQQCARGELHRRRAPHRADVSRQRMGIALRRVDGGRRSGDDGPVPRRRSRWSI